MADAKAKDGSVALKKKIAEQEVIDSMRAYEIKVKQGHDAHEEFKKSRID